MRHQPARGFRMAAFALALAVSVSLTAPVAHAAEPAPAPRVHSQQYRPSQPGGGVGVAGTFELDADYDVLKYVYSFTNDAGFLDKEVLADADGKATIQWTPRVSGQHQIFVSAVTPEGYSQVPSYEFYVLAGGHPAAHWGLDGTLTDSNGANALTSHGNPDLASVGYSGRGAALGDPQDHLSGPVLADTSKNFSLSAWVKVDDGSADRAVVATADGTAFSAGLYFDAAVGRWAFGMTTADRTAVRVAHSQAPAETGVWTHLAGTYEVTTKILSLYVDGVGQGQVTGVEGWQASQLLVGRHRYNGVEVGGAPGAVDEVKVYARTVNEAEVKKLAGQVGLRAHHRFNEGTGGGTRDEVTGAFAPLSGKTGWELDRDDTSLRFNGPDEAGQEQDGEAYVSGSAPGIRTDRSFSISAWARLDTATHEDGDRTVVSLVHNGTSLLDLRYGGTSKTWEFVVGGTTVETRYGVDLQEWTYLTAVHDKANAEVRLYFSGVYVTKVPFTSGGSAQTGAVLEFGRLSPGTAAGSFWKGGIDDVRVYTGVLSQEQILAQAVRT
ncbi:LamG domain-containing protein [Lentzea jiangxiensis]|uniref:Concanavalin A-like lectin/glucanases superfamily protein n=1 Tax=Lentzea jiangxiensis TaxID=641025 RepID=A0A1H0N407_9PSEU|nr:LamG domain-containing protein [Lentzea jiangxiensis]SDO87256.1 Concanavalin A-like lectin/glucanases superfamily protein [Lentzea jiangxiensis]